MDIYYWSDGTELYHHGIKGQKWGIRQYQYEDGTLTPAGRERYGKNARLVENKGKQAKAIANTYKKVSNIISGVSSGIQGASAIAVGLAEAIAYGSALAAAPYLAAAAGVAAGTYLGIKVNNWITDRIEDVYMKNVDSQYVSDGEKYVHSKRH